MIGFAPTGPPTSCVARRHAVYDWPDQLSRSHEPHVQLWSRLTSGPANNPTSIIVLPWVIVGNQLAIVPTDGAGVHVNATILSHAFYLAIEGGGTQRRGSRCRAWERPIARRSKGLFPGDDRDDAHRPSMQLAAQVTSRPRSISTARTAPRPSPFARRCKQSVS